MEKEEEPVMSKSEDVPIEGIRGVWNRTEGNEELRYKEIEALLSGKEGAVNAADGRREALWPVNQRVDFGRPGEPYMVPILHMAVIEGEGNLVQLILEKGAAIEAVVEQSPFPGGDLSDAGVIFMGGETALHATALFSNNPIEIMKILLSAGAELNTKNYDGKTALSLWNEHTEDFAQIEDEGEREEEIRVRKEGSELLTPASKSGGGGRKRKYSKKKKKKSKKKKSKRKKSKKRKSKRNKSKRK